MITGYESPKYISYVSDTWMRTRVEIQLDKIEGDGQYPTRLTYKIFSRRRNLLVKVRFRFYVVIILYPDLIWVKTKIEIFLL